MITEKEYLQKTDITHRKKFAQFFTSELIADFMSQWVLSGFSERIEVLEPAFGLGVFTKSMNRLYHDINITGYDIDGYIYNCAKSNFHGSNISLTLINDNYLMSSWNKKYDAIICNPPYLKFHDYDNSVYIPLVNQKLKIKLNGFTNIYTLFLLKSIYQLKEGGRLAYIIPSEFLNSDYGVEVKRALLKSGTLRHIIIIDFAKNVFDDALTTACILLCEKSGKTEKVHFSKIDDVKYLPFAISKYTTVNVDIIDPEKKWKKYYADTQASKYKSVVPFSTFAKVSRGIATGANKYFTFNESKSHLFNIPNNCLRACICHSIDVVDRIFTEEDYNRLVSSDKTVLLFDGCANNNDFHVKEYLNKGKEQGVDKKYLTSSRSPWYALENRKPSPIWVSVFNRSGLRFVRNKAGVYNLTTFHCVYVKENVDTDILFSYLVTDMAKEIFLDNSRQYGNGLIKFEPNDLNNGYVVDLRLLSENEKVFLKKAYSILEHYNRISDECIKLIDNFFRIRFSTNNVELEYYYSRLKGICKNFDKVDTLKPKNVRANQLNFMSILEGYEENVILETTMVSEELDE